MQEINIHKSRAVSLYLIKNRVLMKSVLSADKAPPTNKEEVHRYNVTPRDVLSTI